MRKSVLILGGAAALALAACDGEPTVRISRNEPASGAALRAVESLQCPEQQGPLTRRATSADGLSCTYSGPRGAEVTLRLVALAGDQTPRSALAAIEAELAGLMPETLARARAGEPETPAAPASDGVGAGGERVDVRLPGLTVRTEGDRAVVRLPGITIDADEGSSRVHIAGVRIEDSNGGENVRVAGRGEDSVSITARDDAAEIRTTRGEGAVRATYILVDERPSSAGWRLVGYEARGPEAGPLVVAVVLSKSRREDEVFAAAKDLVAHNVGR